MALRRDTSRMIRRVARVTRKSKSKPSKEQPFTLLEDVEALSDPDAKVRKEIKERRAEGRKRSKKESE